MLFIEDFMGKCFFSEGVGGCGRQNRKNGASLFFGAKCIYKRNEDQYILLHKFPGAVVRSIYRERQLQFVSNMYSLKDEIKGEIHHSVLYLHS